MSSAASAPRGRPLPHPKDKPVLGSMPDFAKDTLQTFVNGWRECGDVVQFRGIRTMCLVAHPDGVEHVLEENQRNYRTSPRTVAKLGPLFGSGLFLSEGELWRSQRRLVEPAFHGEGVQAFEEIVAGAAAELLERWEASGDGSAEVDMKAEMVRMGLDTMARALLGATDDELPAIRRAMIVANEYAIPAVMSIGGPPDVVVPAYHRSKRALGELDAIIYPRIAARRRDPGHDLLTMFVHARDEDGREMSDRQVRDEVMTAIFSGYKGAANGLTWTWYLLSKSPEVMNRLRAELTASLDGRPATRSDLPNLPYTAAVVAESLRLYPPIWIMARQAAESDEIGGYHIPAGMSVIICQYITHRHPAFWQNPEGFIPERFLGTAGDDHHPYAYFPFSGGPRRCLGDEFALMQMQIVLATVAQHYRPQVVPGYEIKTKREFVLRPRDALHFTLTRVARPGDDGEAVAPTVAVARPAAE